MASSAGILAYAADAVMILRMASSMAGVPLERLNTMLSMPPSIRSVTVTMGLS
jgi:hypothetical protein